MASFDAEFFMDSLDPEDKFCLRYDDVVPDPDPTPPRLGEHEAQFEMFLQHINSLYWDLTSGMSRLHAFGIDQTQEVLVSLTRYMVLKLREAYYKHPLYDRIMEDRYG